VLGSFASAALYRLVTFCGENSFMPLSVSGWNTANGTCQGPSKGTAVLGLSGRTCEGLLSGVGGRPAVGKDSQWRD